MAESESTEMYLKTIFELYDDDEPVAISQVAERLGVSAVSATEMIKRLSERDMVVHTPYKGVELTESGRLRALSVVRRQRLWGRFLTDYLGIAWERTYELSCRLEHATDDEVTEALADFLNHPETCPHGHGIPAADGTLNEIPAVPLNEFRVGQAGQVARISRPETPLLEYLAERGIMPGAALSVEDIAPYNGPFTVTINDREIAVGREIAARILVTVIT